METTNTTQTKETLIDRVIGSIKDDLAQGDETVLDELLGMVPSSNLIMSLPEEVWPELGGVSPEYQGRYGKINAAFDALKENMNAAIKEVANRLADRELFVFTSDPHGYLDMVESNNALELGDCESVLINFAPAVSYDKVFGLCNRGPLVERFSGSVSLADLNEMSLNDKYAFLELIDAPPITVTLSEMLWATVPECSVFDVEPVAAP